LATKRSYALVAGTDTNLIFVKRDELKGSLIHERTLQDIRDNTFQLRYFFSFDGTVLHTYHEFMTAGVTELYPVPWAFTLATQPLPKLFRRRSDKINFAAVTFSLLIAVIRCPLQLIKLVIYIVRRTTKEMSHRQILALVMKKDKLTSFLKNGT
jgi:hypothetical protein